MTTAQEMKISAIVLAEIISLAKLHGIDYNELDPKQKEFTVSVFQLGVRFINEIAQKSVL
jgi:hypothetical protein